jgi:membrane-associated protein
MQFFNAILHFDQYLDIVVGQYGSMVYIALFTIIFCETALLVLFFLPGDPLLFISGALCATGAMNIWIRSGPRKSDSRVSGDSALIERREPHK